MPKRPDSRSETSSAVWVAGGPSATGDALHLALRAMGLAPHSEPDGCLFAVVDLTQPEGLAPLHALRRDAATRDLLVVALIGPGSAADFEAAVAAGADALVDADRWPIELAPRLELLRRRARERDTMLRHDRDLAALLELTGQFADSADASELIHKVVRLLASELGLARCALIVFQEGNTTARVVASSDGDGPVDVELARYPELRAMLQTGQGQVLEDARHHPLLEPVKAELVNKDIGALAALPLAVGGRVLGALLLRATAARPAFSPREIAFASTVAHATAVALRNARQLQQAQAEVEALARYQGFFKAFQQGVVVLDRSGNLLTVNPAGEALLRGKPAPGAPLFPTATPSADEAINELINGAMEGRFCGEVDLPMRLPSGDAAIFAVSSAPLAEQEGELKQAVILCFRDVTRARTMQVELRTTKDFLERLIHQAADAIVAAKPDGTITIFNHSAERIWGQTAAELVGKQRARTLYPSPEVAREILASLHQAAKEGRERVGPLRLDVLNHAGERVPVSMTASLLYDHHGDNRTEVGSVGIFTDMRDRLTLEQKLSVTQEKLQQTEKAAVVAELAGTAAHELNQPLTSIMGYAELLRRRIKEDDPNSKHVDIIYREAERMAEVVRKIGKITRYETKPYVGSARIVDLDRASEAEEES